MNEPVPIERSLAGRRILVTRAEHQSRELTSELAVRGADVIACPVLSIVPHPVDPPALDAYDWVVVTSPNGITHLDALLGGPEPAVWADGPRLAVVGPGTAAKAAARGWRVDLQPGTATGEGLAAAFGSVPALRGARVLRVRGDRAPTLVEDTLTALGAVVTPLTVYRTLAVAPPPDALRALQTRETDVVVFASGSAVDALLAGAPDLDLPSTLPAACIGPVTAAHAEATGWARVIVASEPSAAGLAAALARQLGPASD